MQREYVVEGYWPFPRDMLRRDQAHAATPEDAELIKRMSQTHSDGLGMRAPVRIKLLLDGEGRREPNHARWNSFGWAVLGEDVGPLVAPVDPSEKLELALRTALTRVTAFQRELGLGVLVSGLAEAAAAGVTLSQRHATYLIVLEESLRRAWPNTMFGER